MPQNRDLVNGKSPQSQGVLRVQTAEYPPPSKMLAPLASAPPKKRDAVKRVLAKRHRFYIVATGTLGQEGFPTSPV